jgi:hypothetical protein
MTELKRLSKEAIPNALARADRYRLLNEPEQAESICLDILEIEPTHQQALVTLLLALTEQFDQHMGKAFNTAQNVLPRLDDVYQQVYYRGLIFERRANSHLRCGGPGVGEVAYDWYRRAMECYEKAMELRPPGNDEPILRWNSCVRIIERHPQVKPVAEPDFHPMLE